MTQGTPTLLFLFFGIYSAPIGALLKARDLGAYDLVTADLDPRINLGVLVSDLDLSPFTCYGTDSSRFFLIVLLIVVTSYLSCYLHYL